MGKHYLIAALRRFRLHKATTAVNTVCLALGLTCFVVAWGASAYFGAADSQQANASRLQIIISSDASEVNEPVLPVGSALLADYLATDFPQLEAVSRVTTSREMPVAIDNNSLFARVVYVDPGFLTMFDLPLSASTGSDAKTLLSSPGSAIISREIASRLFGTDDVAGRTFRLGGGKGGAQNVTVTGVVEPIRQPSQLTTGTATTPYQTSFDLLVSSDMDPAQFMTQRWNVRGFLTYVLLPRDGSLTAEDLNAQLDAFARRHVPTDGDGGQLRFRAYPAAAVTQITFDALVGSSFTGVSSPTVLMILGGMVLLVACFNYANLATAQYIARAREISLRRVLGAKSFQVIAQHVTEGLLLTGVAVLASLLCISAVLAVVGLFPSVSRIFIPMPRFWLFLGALVVVVGVIASAAPAIALSRVRPADSQRGIGGKGGSRFFPNLLVGLQFAFASFLLVAVFVFIAQNRAMSRAIASPGSDPVVVIANDVSDAGVDPQSLKAELSNQLGIGAVGGMEYAPFTAFRFTDVAETPEASSERLRTTQHLVDPEIFTALDIPLVAGRLFDTQRADDTANVEAWRDSDSAAAADYNVVIERALTQRLGFEAPEQAVGAVIYRPTSEDESTSPQRLHVIGVVENAVIVPVTLGAPNLYLMNADAAVVPVIRVSKSDVAAGLASIDKVWARLAPDVPLRRRFTSEQYEAAYGLLNVVDDVFAALGTLATAIAVMGLIGMALHATRRRAKEIAVRKVNGASVRQILWMLLASFSKPVLIANLAVWPLVYLVMLGYLSLFAVRSGLGPLPFLTALLVALGVAWLAVIGQVARAARTSPATVLRSE
jgi:putative ABC transport system permease protein